MWIVADARVDGRDDLARSLRQAGVDRPQSAKVPDSELVLRAYLRWGPGCLDRLGARRVFSIEPNDAIEVARINARASGFGDRIEIFADLSTRVNLPEPVDLIVSDLRGTLPPAGSHLAATIDARRRFLKPGGLVIPEQDFLYVAVVEACEATNKGWDYERFGLDLNGAARFIANTPARIVPGDVSPEDLSTEPQLWRRLDYRRLDSPHVEGSVRLEATRPGKAAGMVAFFEARIFEEHGYSTGPGSPDVVYGTGWFPFERKLDLDAGDCVVADIRAMFDGDDYVWTWNTIVRTRRALHVPR